MEDKLCEAKHKEVDKMFKTYEKRLNSHSASIEALKLKATAQEKDTTHLQVAIESLKISIDSLIQEISKLKAKPLERYEKVAMVIVSGVIGYLVSKWF